VRSLEDLRRKVAWRYSSEICSLYGGRKREHSYSCIHFGRRTLLSWRDVFSYYELQNICSHFIQKFYQTKVDIAEACFAICNFLIGFFHSLWSPACVSHYYTIRHAIYCKMFISLVYISSDLFDLFIHREVNERQLQCSSAGQSDLIYFSPKLIQPHALHHCPILFARSTREGATIAARSCPNTRWWKP